MCKRERQTDLRLLRLMQHTEEITCKNVKAVEFEEENQTQLNIQTGKKTKTTHIATQTRYEANICINICMRYIIYISKAVCAPTALTAQICGVLLAHWSDSHHLSQSQSEQEVRFSIPPCCQKKLTKCPNNLKSGLPPLSYLFPEHKVTTVKKISETTRMQLHQKSHPPGAALINRSGAKLFSLKSNTLKLPNCYWLSTGIDWG